MACAGAASRSSASSARAALYAAVAFVLLLVLCMVVANVAGTSRHPYDLCLAERQSPPAAVARHPGTIFVSIASYRDHECPATVESLFAMASDPTRIHVGLCIQNAEGDPFCPDKKCVSCIPQNIRTVSMPHSRARGPAYARYHCAGLYAGQDYFMQIDSHMQFIQDWDDLLIHELKKCRALLSPGAHSAVLTHYPPADMTDEVRARAVTTHICRGTFENTGMISFLSNQFQNQDKPMPTYYLASGFLFGPGRMVLDVPYDPHMDFLFWGEEFLHAMRLWTSGYDIFSPGIAICSHSYERNYAPNVFVDSDQNKVNWTIPQEKSHDRVRYLLGWPARRALTPDVTAEADRYGAGKVRSREDYMLQAGIDPIKKTVGSTCLY